jgi:hypothetical protein
VDPSSPAYRAVSGYLRRKYWLASTATWNLTALRVLADTTFAAATRTVTITTTSSEAGGSASGTITFDRMILLAALEDILAVADAANSPPGPATQTQVTFRS